MWFFDSILEEAPKTGVVSPSAAKKDEQDGSFLIIDDSISANQLPDTAVQLFDAMPEVVMDTKEVTSTSEISFFSEPAASVGGEEGSVVTGEVVESPLPEIAFFDEPIGDIETIASISEMETDGLVLFTEDSAAEIFEEGVTLTATEEITEPIQEEVNVFNLTPIEKIEEMAIIPASVSEENDIYAPMRKAIAEYDTILGSLAQIADAKDAEIVEHNARAAEAKSQAKKALDDRKVIGTKMSGVEQMKSVLFAQIK